MMMMIVLRLLSLPGRDRGVFHGAGESVDSWTPGPKPLCHRHPTGPHPSGLPWTLVDSRQGQCDEKQLRAGALRPDGTTASKNSRRNLWRDEEQMRLGRAGRSLMPAVEFGRKYM